MHKRVLKNGLIVYSFFKYDNIAPILHVKHYFWGHRILSFIAKKTFTIFSKQFIFEEPIAVLPIDDKIKSGYSHTAILAKSLKTKNLIPFYGALRAKSNISYSGKSYNFRKKNPRNFALHEKIPRKVILVDDIVTSGFTLEEASSCLKQNNIEVLFALTLADAQE